jgi:phage tail sheath gpL-like
MASTAVVTITSAEPSASLIARLNKTGKHEGVQALSTLLDAIASGAVDGKVEVAMGAVAAASAAIAVTYANVDADDTVTIGGVTLTAKASGANGTTQFNKETDAATTAENLADCINANTTLSSQVTAVAATGTVSLTAIHEGAEGNLIVLSTSDGTAFGLTQFSGGSDGTTKTYSFGIA